MIEKLQAEKGTIEKMHVECRQVLAEHITTQSVEKLEDHRTHVKEKVTHLYKVFHEF
jgi:hypothetical protein